MKVELTVTRSDLAWLNISQLFRVKSNLRVFVIILLLVTFFTWRGATKEASDIDWVTVAVSSAGVSIAAFSAFFLVSLVFVLVSSTAKSGVIGNHIYTIEDSGLRELTEANDSLNFWPSIQSIEKTSKAIIIQINAYLFHVLPRRGFDSDAHYDAFLMRSQIIVARRSHA